MDGLQATIEIRKIEAGLGRKFKIFGLTGDGGEENQKKAADCGMDALITKPLSIVKLKEVIEAFN